MVEARNAQSEARALLGGDVSALVLEPSPPAVTVEPFADDPLAGPEAGAPVVLPFATAPDPARWW
ncbi:MAG: hypothetical protein AAGK32_05885, partial [Actinomycetota bacterium]